MARLVDVTKRPSDSEWDRLVRAAPHPLFFATREYAAVCEESFPNTSAAPRAYRFDDGVEVLVPGMEERAAGGVVRVFKSVLPSDSGGFLSSCALGPDHMAAISDDLRGAGYSRVMLYDSPFGLHPALPGFTVAEDFTHLLDITDGYDGLVKRMTQQNRQAMRLAIKNGVRVETRSDQLAVDEFYRLYRMSAERWGDLATWVRPVEYLRALIDRTPDGAVCIRLAYLGDLAIGGQVDYLFDGVSVSGWRAFDYEYRSMYPNLLTLAAAVTQEHEQGFVYHDMGPSSGLEGLELSKDRCGARRVAFRVWTWETAGHKVYRTGRRSLDRAQDAIRSARGQ